MPDYNDRYIPPAENRPAHPSLRKNIVNGYNTFFCLNDNIVGIYLNIPYSILTFDLLIELGTSANIDRDNPPDFVSGETVTIQRNIIKPSWANTGRTPDARYIGDIMDSPEYLPLLPSAFVSNYDKSLDGQAERSKVSTNYKQAAGFYYGALIPIDCDYPAVHMRNCLPIIFREEDADISILDEDRRIIENMNTYITNVGATCSEIAEHISKEHGLIGSAATRELTFPNVDNDYNPIGTYTMTITHLTAPGRQIYRDSLADINITYIDANGDSAEPPAISGLQFPDNKTSGEVTLDSIGSFCTQWVNIIRSNIEESETRSREYITESTRIYNTFVLSSLNDEMKFLHSLARLHDVALTDSSTASGGKALSNIISAEDNKSIIQSSYPTRLNAAATRKEIESIFSDRMEIFRHGALYVVTVDASDPAENTKTRLHLVRSGTDTAVMSDIDTNNEQTMTYSPLPPVMEVISQPINLGITNGVNILNIFDTVVDNMHTRIAPSRRTEIKDSDFDAKYLFGQVDVLTYKSNNQPSDINTLQNTMENTYKSLYRALSNIYEGDDILTYSIFPLLFSFGQGMFLIDDTTNFYIRLHDNMPTEAMRNTDLIERLSIESTGHLFEHDYGSYPPAFLRSAGIEYSSSSFNTLSDRSPWQGPFWEKIREIGELIATKELDRYDPNGPIKYMFVRDEDNTVACPTPITHYVIPESPVDGHPIDVGATNDIDIQRHHVVCVYDTRNQGAEDSEDKIQINIKAHPRMNEELADIVDDDDFDPDNPEEPETISINEIRLPNLSEIKQHYFIRDPRVESRRMADLMRKWTKIVTVREGVEEVQEGNRYPVADMPGYSINYMRNEVPNLMNDIATQAKNIHDEILSDDGSDSLLHNILLYENNIVEFNKNTVKRFINIFYKKTVDAILAKAEEDIDIARSAAMGSIGGLITQVSETLEPDNYQQVRDGLTDLREEKLNGNQQFSKFVESVGKHAKIIISEIIEREDDNIFDTLLDQYPNTKMNTDNTVDLIKITEETDNVNDIINEYGTAICDYDDLDFIEEIDGKYKYSVKLIEHSSLRDYMVGDWATVSDDHKYKNTLEGCVLKTLGDSNSETLLITKVLNIEEDLAESANSILTFISNVQYDTETETVVDGTMYDVAVFRGQITSIMGGTDKIYRVLSLTSYRRFRESSTTPSHASLSPIDLGIERFNNPRNTQLIGCNMLICRPETMPDEPDVETIEDNQIIIDSLFNDVTGTDPQLSMYVETHRPININHVDCRVIIYRSRDRWSDTIWNYLPIFVHNDYPSLLPNQLDDTYDDLFTAGISYDCSTNKYMGDKHRMPASDAGLLSEIKPYMKNDSSENSRFKRSYNFIDEQLRQVYIYMKKTFLDPFDALGGYNTEPIWDEFYSLDDNLEEGTLIPPQSGGLTDPTLQYLAQYVVRPNLLEIVNKVYIYIYYVIASLKDVGLIMEKFFSLFHKGETIKNTRAGMLESMGNNMTDILEIFQSILDENPFNTSPIYSSEKTKLRDLIETWKFRVMSSRNDSDLIKNATYIPPTDGTETDIYHDNLDDFIADYFANEEKVTKIVPQSLLGVFSSQINTLINSSIAAINNGYTLTETMNMMEFPVTIREMHPESDNLLFIYRGTVEGHALLYIYLLYLSFYISIEEALITIATRLLQFYCIEEDIDYPGDTFGTMGGLELVEKREWIELLGASLFHKSDGDTPLYPIIPEEGIEMDGGITIKKHEISNILDYDMPFRYKINIKLPDDLDKDLHKVLFKDSSLGWYEDFPEDEE